MVPVKTTVESVLARHVEQFTRAPSFRRLETGEASPEEYDHFVANLIRTHLRSPQIVAFLLAMAPPRAADTALHNLLEELGVEDESGVAHPALLDDLAAGAGLSSLMPDLERLASEDLRSIATQPLLYGTLKEVGLAALYEVVAFEFMLSRTASRIARALATHRGLLPEALTWFHHHSEVDIAHAQQGLQHIEEYVRYYEISEQEAADILDLTLRQNAFVRRYFAQAPATLNPAFRA
jgi:pyrroloquinoline quinone (PQQ) biosynthesis protein C